MSWFLNLPQLLRIAIAGTLAIVMFLGIWHFSQKRQANEAVWATGEAELAHAREKLPLTVYIDLSFGAHRDGLTKAVELTNKATCTLMVEVSKPAGVDIHIRHTGCSKDADRQPNHPGCTWLDPTTGQIIIEVGQPGDLTTSFLIFWHELTHAWGLAHDGVYRVPRRVEDSSMFIPITANNAPEHAYRLGHGLFLPRLSDKDTAALLDRYCSPE